MINFWLFSDMIMQTNWCTWVLALKVLIHEYYWSCPLRLQYKNLLIFWCVCSLCTRVLPSAKGPRDIERWELNWLYSLVQKLLNALKIALVYIQVLNDFKKMRFGYWRFCYWCNGAHSWQKSALIGYASGVYTTGGFILAGQERCSLLALQVGGWVWR